MRRGIAVGVLILSLTSSALGTTSIPQQSGFNFQKIVRQLFRKIVSLDEILTGSKP